MIAIILARGGSKSIPKKNIALLDGIPLLGHVIKTAKRSKFINQIIVSTDDVEIANVATKYGATIISRRPDLATDHSLDIDVFKDIVNTIKLTDDFIHLRATTPIISTEIIDRGIQYFLDNKDKCTSMRSGHEMSESIVKFFKLNGNYFEGIYRDYTKFLESNRQDVEKTFKPNGYIDIVKPSFFMNSLGLLYGPDILAYLTPHTIEIDSKEDLEQLEFLLSKQKFSLKKFDLTPQATERIETKHRKIITNIPAPSTIGIIQKCLEHEPYSMNNQLPIVWDRAVDYQVFDNAGNCWIDFTSTIFVANVGHSNKSVLNAIRECLDKQLLNAYYYPTKERAYFVETLTSLTPEPLKKVLLLSTGSEAVEAAMKMTIMHHKKKTKSEKSYIVAFEKSFHGKTMGAQMAGGKEPEKQWINSKNDEIIHMPFPYPSHLKALKQTGKEYFQDCINRLLRKYKITSDEIAGFICEPYQGWCAIFYPNDYIQELCDWSKRNKALVIMDEVQSGFGRTGRFFAYEHFKIIPDIVICGKAISSSLPLSAVIFNKEISDSMDESFNSTHGGNPVAVAAGHASIKELINKDLINISREKGFFLQSLLEKWQLEMPDYIKEFHVKGLLASVFIINPINDGNDKMNYNFVDDIIEIAMRKGLLSIRTGSGTLKIGPPLTIPREAIEEGVNVLKESLLEAIKIN